MRSYNASLSPPDKTRTTSFALSTARAVQTQPEMAMLADLLARVVEAKVAQHFERERQA